MSFAPVRRRAAPVCVVSAFIFFTLCGLELSAQGLPDYIQSQYPASGATGVARNSAIAIRFGPTIDVSSANFTLRQKTGENVLITPEFSFGDTGYSDFVYRPLSVLAASTTYTFAVKTATINYQFDFTTGSTFDNSAPHLIGITPQPGAQAVTPFGPFTLRFDKELVSPLVSIAVTDGTGFDLGSARLTLSSDRRSIEVRPQFAYRIAPIVQISLDPTKIRDLTGNYGVGATTTARFNTTLLSDTHGPHILGRFPEAGEGNVPTNAMVQLLFDRLLYEPSIRGGGIVLETGGTSVPLQPQVTGSVVKLSGVTLLPSTSYHVRITTRLWDSNGVPVEQETAWDFTTAAAPDPDPTDPTLSGPQYPSITIEVFSPDPVDRVLWRGH